MSSVRLAALAALVGCASLWSVASHAQVYRIVGPDGKVTFTDRPVPEAQASAAGTTGAAGGGSSSGSLPLALRNVVSRYPVTLYTSNDCSPCGAARAQLTSRGVPFTEKTVRTSEDIKALSAIAGEPRLPFATIGGQHVRGYSEQEYAAYLDAAGYPKSSQLPASWRNPPATPLVAMQETPTNAGGSRAEQQAPVRAEPPPPSAPSPSNPAGIRF